MSTGTFYYPRLLQTLYNLVLNTSRDGNPGINPGLQRSNPLARPQRAKEAAKHHFQPLLCHLLPPCQTQLPRGSRTSPGAVLGQSCPEQRHENPGPISDSFTQLLNTRTIFGVNKLPEEPRTGQVPRATPTAQIGP